MPPLVVSPRRPIDPSEEDLNMYNLFRSRVAEYRWNVKADRSNSGLVVPPALVAPTPLRMRPDGGT
jgi:hypothetical protein